MNKQELSLYLGLGIMVGGMMPTSAISVSEVTDVINVIAMKSVIESRNESLSVYKEVTKIQPKKNYRQRYARISSSKAFLDSYSGKSLGEVIKVEY